MDSIELETGGGETLEEAAGADPEIDTAADGDPAADPAGDGADELPEDESDDEPTLEETGEAGDGDGAMTLIGEDEAPTDGEIWLADEDWYEDWFYEDWAEDDWTADGGEEQLWAEDGSDYFDGDFIWDAEIGGDGEGTDVAINWIRIDPIIFWTGEDEEPVAEGAGEATEGAGEEAAGGAPDLSSLPVICVCFPLDAVA
jgi:hypothetical protein